jgi:hypothetical protein
MTPPSELPPPDVLDHAGRLRRAVISVLIGIAAATAVYYLTSSLAKPDELPGGLYGGGQAERAYNFVFYMTGLAGAVAITLSMLVLNWLARRRERASWLPQAQAQTRRRS